MNEDLMNQSYRELISAQANIAAQRAPISLRDRFAMAALTGLCAQSDSPFHENVAKQAYALADLMLEQRKP